MIIATAGHVDHGKTLLVKALTGISTDKLSEEISRGLTIELGFAYKNFGTHRLGFVDVPGHIRFIHNMLAGVGAVDYVLLVIAADDGPMPQTIEHLAIINELGISRGAIALTKIDRVSSARLTEVKRQIGELVSGTFLAEAAILPCSGINLDGIEALKAHLTGAAASLQSKLEPGHFRLAIDRIFTVKGAGLVVTGAVTSGRVAIGDELTLLAQGKTVRVRQIHRQNVNSDSAQAGDRCALNLASVNLSRQDVHRGDWLTSNPSLTGSHRVDVQVRVLKAERTALKHWTPVHIHSAAKHALGRIATLQDSKINPGETGFVQMVSDEPLFLCAGDRLILRDQGANRTIAGGLVIQMHSPQRGRNAPLRVAHLQKQVLAVSLTEKIAALLESTDHGILLSSLEAQLNRSISELTALIKENTDWVTINQTLITKKQLAALGQSLITQLRHWHSQHPNQYGIEVNRAVGFLPRQINFANDLLDILAKQKILKKTGALVAVKDFNIRLSDAAQVALDKVLPLLSQEPSKPPVLHDLAKITQIDPRQLEKILMECVKAGRLVRPVANRFYRPDAINSLKDLIIDNFSDRDFTVQEYRDAAGIGRNLAIELLEHFDRQGFTRRNGNFRQALPSKT
ncbi:MAG: selenocysteine-specific translation elongation factor [Gammaproteobacteria bacterium]|jgi:selenocysteine-specific elongation factor|nr:selenocysteine-specific translation elongation factor [Gammaproteobacteria bacterium]MBT5202474.1 selenocysteine-specific translation elongation factor [Gammaproteobacteria bacterium]MBT5601898.1 selenocysteine-specific translation elongation factor [Gammaproteobacteria bacterium]